jgi:hypothetical protein
MRQHPLLLALASFALATTAAAQAKDPDPSIPVKGGSLEAGWSMRLDNVDVTRGRKVEDAKFAKMGSGFHVTSGPRAIYWHPSHVAKAPYTASVAMTQTKQPPMGHGEAYGLFVGGRNLDTPQQEYLYFVTRGDGMYLIKHAIGNELHTLADWTAHPAIVAKDSAGKATNTLAVRVTADSVVFMANGKPVKSHARSEMHGFNFDGQVGLRVSHNLDIHISSLTVSK